jgi:hypothetical protein
LQCDGDRGDYFQIGSVFIKRSNQTGYLKKKPKPNRNRFKPTVFGSVILEQKSVQTGSVVFQLGSVFPVLLGFFLVFLFGFGSVWFFQFQAYKTEIEPNQMIF